MHISPLVPTVLLLLALTATALPADEAYSTEEEGYDTKPAKKCPPAGKKEEVKDGKQYICIKEVLETTCPADGLDGDWKAKLTDADEMKREIPDGKKDKAGFVWVCTKDTPEENCCYKEKKWSWEKRCCTEGDNKGKKEGDKNKDGKGYWHCNRDKPLELKDKEGKPKESKPWAWVLFCKDPCKRKVGDEVVKGNAKKGKWKCCDTIYEWVPECGGKNHPQAKEYTGKFPIEPEDKDLWECVDNKWVLKCKCPPAGKKEGVEGEKEHICIKDDFICTCPVATGLDGEWKDKLTDKDRMKRELPDGKKDKAGFVWACTQDKPLENCCYKEKKWSWEKRCCTEGDNKGKKEGDKGKDGKGFWHCNRDKPVDLGKDKEGKPKESKPWAWVLYCKDPCKRKNGDEVVKGNAKKGKWSCCTFTFEWAPECGGKKHPQLKEFSGKFPIEPEDKDKWECVNDKWTEKKVEEEGYATS